MVDITFLSDWGLAFTNLQETWGSFLNSIDPRALLEKMSSWILGLSPGSWSWYTYIYLVVCPPVIFSALWGLESGIRTRQGITKKWYINPLTSIGAGVLITTSVAQVFVPYGVDFLNGLVDLRVPYPLLSFFVYELPLITVVAAAIGLSSRTDILQFHEGVPSILGIPLAFPVFTHGIHWIPRGIITQQPVNMQERTEVIPGIETYTAGPRPAPLHIDVTLVHWVIDSFRFLRAGGKDDKKRVDFLRGLSEQGLRAVIGRKTLIEALMVRDEITNLLQHIGSCNRMSERERNEYGISEELDRAALRWGIDVRNSFISNPLPEKEVLDALKRLITEEFDTDAETTEMAHIGRLIRFLMGEPLTTSTRRFNPTEHRFEVVQATEQLPPNAAMSKEEAISTVLLQLKRITKNIDERRLVIHGETGVVLQEIAKGVLQQASGNLGSTVESILQSLGLKKSESQEQDGGI
jgi:regulator of protease activity HflC (stomatin/prohibitin superfamily)